VVVAVGAACVLVAVWLIRQRRDRNAPHRAELAVAVAAGVAVVAYYLAIPYVYNVRQGMRYVAPLLIPTAALAVLAAAHLRGGAATRVLAVATCAGLVVGMFVRPTADRVVEAVTARTQVSFQIGPNNFNLNRYAFHRTTWEIIHAAQATIPPGAPTLAWVATPFHLDFARNPVYTIPDPAFSERWLHIPINDHPEDLAAFLRGRGIRYVMWGYNMPGMRSDALLEQDLMMHQYAAQGRITLGLKDVLAALRDESEVTFDDGHVVVLAVPGPAPRTPAGPPPPATP